VDEAPQTEQPFRSLNEARLVRGILSAIGEDQQLAPFWRQFAQQRARYVSKRRRITQADGRNDIEAAIPAATDRAVGPAALEQPNGT
jgi:hypothetical protein